MDWHFSCTRLCSGRQRESDQALFLEITSRFPRLPRRYVCSNLAKHLGVPQQLRLKSKKEPLLLVVAPWSDSTAKEQKLKMCLLVHFQHHVKTTGHYLASHFRVPHWWRTVFASNIPVERGQPPHTDDSNQQTLFQNIIQLYANDMKLTLLTISSLAKFNSCGQMNQKFRDQGMSENRVF